MKIVNSEYVIFSDFVSMANVLYNSANNVEEEFMWACLLDEDSKEFEWLPEDPTKPKNEDESEELKPSHRLLIKNAILMPEAEKDDVNVVQIECEGYNKKKVFLRITVKLRFSNFLTI